jgi:hypothetical protein
MVNLDVITCMHEEKDECILVILKSLVRLIHEEGITTAHIPTNSYTANT